MSKNIDGVRDDKFFEDIHKATEAHFERLKPDIERAKEFNQSKGWLWYIHPKTNELEKLEASGLKGVFCIDKDGVCTTCYGITAWSEIYGAKFYATKEQCQEAYLNSFTGEGI